MLDKSERLLMKMASRTSAKNRNDDNWGISKMGTLPSGRNRELTTTRMATATSSNNRSEKNSIFDTTFMMVETSGRNRKNDYNDRGITYMMVRTSGNPDYNNFPSSNKNREMSYMMVETSGKHNNDYSESVYRNRHSNDLGGYSGGGDNYLKLENWPSEKPYWEEKPYLKEQDYKEMMKKMKEKSKKNF